MALVGLCLGLGLGYKLFAGHEPPKVVSVDKSKEKKSGTIARHIERCADGTVKIDEVEAYAVDSQNNVSTISTPADKNNILAYIPKYNLDTGRLYHSAFYSYKDIGVYVAENREAGLVFTFKW
jgi:hypothetical protein